MGLTFGTKVVYPTQGPCLIGKVVERHVDDSTLLFYQLLVLHGSGGSLFVPVDKIRSLGIRPMLEESQIPKLFDRLKTRTRSSDTWRERNLNNLKLFASGSPFDLAEVVACLTDLRERKALSFGEAKTLEKAKRLLVCEISEVIGKSLEEAEEQVDTAFKARNQRVKKSGLRTRGRPARSGTQNVDRKEVPGQVSGKAHRSRP